MLRSPLPKSCELVSTARKHFRVPRIRPVELSSQSHRWTSQVEQSKQPARATPKQPLKLHKSNASASANPVTSAAGKQPLANANASNSNIAPASPKLQHGYPEQLLIYHAGKGRTIFISCVKLTGIFIFIFSACMIAPAYYISPFEPTWMAPVVLIGGAIPLTIMVLTTAPFVTYVHLHLPLWARASSSRLHRYAASLPSSAQLDMTTLKWLWPRVTRLRASELYVHKGEVLGAMTLRRDVPDIVKEQRKWYDWQPIKKFYVAGKSGERVPERGIWEGVVGSVVRGWGKPGQREKLLKKR